ncbi:MAG TPA: TetR/AcrR family transcriptional regulator, partial [Epsilonproteobacteria bacterium]|nr:TetR/AcrR family transcriptional regulator [Campylobacterota bacterium]
ESTWGVLSLSPSLSSSRHFIKHSKYILENLDTCKN